MPVVLNDPQTQDIHFTQWLNMRCSMHLRMLALKAA